MKKYLYILISTLLLIACAARPARAQFLGYTSPQTEQQVLATNVACTGANQFFSPSNLGQTQHYVTVTPAGVSTLSIKIMGQDVNGNNLQISEAVFPGTSFSNSNILTGSGYFPKIVVNVICTGGTFSLTYSGSSATSNVNAGSYLLTQLNKSVFTSAPTNTTVGTQTFIAPYGSSFGKLMFQYSTAGVAGSTLQVVCSSAGVLLPYATWTYPLANSTALQPFQLPDSECPTLSVSYTSGGASANTFSLDYVFDFPGRNGVTTSAGTLSAALNLGAQLSEKGARWIIRANPAAGGQASISQSASIIGSRHVADCVSFSGGSIVAPALTSLTVNLRDGATGAGTLLWSQTVVISAVTGQNVNPFSICGLNLIGSANTAMTVEYSASLANLIEAVSLTGYDVQ